MSRTTTGAAPPEAIRVCMDVLPLRATIVGAAVADYARDLYTPLD